ncbi:hypothetical protein EJ05DRAFT_483785 [Pseudovirgaria hyperparasitica]|uniref:Uncharacterized protein n=1 Tax=Pseudovirgaria hyperparasitica TaxID=470096 RepID=A0A6A6WID4_9PEZI|nr:uncharacterized protein EJ05DRAFT_483785 [Pseudovirgaria hyperparasitica]KAF2761417.1 hypothetical protein EJ05DRAFT_483785 [Pseudovirgaria hyperparasitica]
MTMFDNVAPDTRPQRPSRNNFYSNFDATFNTVDLPGLITGNEELPTAEDADHLDQTNVDPFDDAFEVDDLLLDSDEDHYFPHRLSVISERTEPLSLSSSQRGAFRSSHRNSHRDSFEATLLVSTHPYSRDMSQRSLRGPLPMGSNQLALRSRSSLRSLPVEEESDSDSDANSNYDSPVLRTESYSDSNTYAEPQTPPSHSRSSSTSTIKAYPIPQWTIPQPNPQPLPSRPMYHSSTPSWVTVASETKPEPEDSEDDWVSERSITPTVESSVTPNPSPSKRSTASAPSPFTQRIVSQGLAGPIQMRSQTPITALEGSLQQKACQIACLVGAPEPERFNKLRPTSFHQRVCRALEAKEARIITPDQPNYATRAMLKESSPLDALSLRFQQMSSTMSNIGVLESALEDSWGVSSTDTTRPVLYTQAAYQTADVTAARRPPQVPAFLQCAGVEHQLYPVYPKAFFGMHAPAKAVAKKPSGWNLLVACLDPRRAVKGKEVSVEAEEVPLAPQSETLAMCDVCSRAIERTRWVCRVSGCGVEVRLYMAIHKRGVAHSRLNKCIIQSKIYIELTVESPVSAD